MKEYKKRNNVVDMNKKIDDQYNILLYTRRLKNISHQLHDYKITIVNLQH